MIVQAVIFNQFLVHIDQVTEDMKLVDACNQKERELTEKHPGVLRSRADSLALPFPFTLDLVSLFLKPAMSIGLPNL